MHVSDTVDSAVSYRSASASRSSPPSNIPRSLFDVPSERTAPHSLDSIDASGTPYYIITPSISFYNVLVVYIDVVMPDATTSGTPMSAPMLLRTTDAVDTTVLATAAIGTS